MNLVEVGSVIVYKKYELKWYGIIVRRDYNIVVLWADRPKEDGGHVQTFATSYPDGIDKWVVLHNMEIIHR